MTTKEQKSIVRLISRQLFSIFLIVSLLAALGYFLWLLQAEKNQIIAEQYLPQIENKDRDQKALLSAISTINEIVSKQTASEFPALHNSLKADLEQLKNGVFRTAVIADSAYYETGNTDLNLSRIADNSELNEALKFSAQRQLQKVVDNLQIETLDKEVTLDQLYTQIVNDTSNDRITANRARAHAKLAQKLNSFHHLDRLTTELSIQLAQLKVNTSQEAFAKLALKLDQTFSIYDQLLEDSLINNDELKIQFENLEKLLFSEQLGISKWRGYLRMAEPYLSAVNTQRQQLLNILSLQPNSKVDKVSNDSPILQHLINLSQLKISQQELLWFFYGLGVLFSFLFLISLVSAHRKIAKFSNGNQRLCEEILAAKHDEHEALIATSSFIEQSRLASTMSQVSKPAHGESDYQQLKKRLVSAERLILERAKTCVWFANLDISSIENHSVWQLLDFKPANNNLLSILKPFSRSQRAIFISTARKVLFDGNDQIQHEPMVVCLPADTNTVSKNDAKTNVQSNVLRTFSIVLKSNDSSFIVAITDISGMIQLENTLQAKAEHQDAIIKKHSEATEQYFAKLELEMSNTLINNRAKAFDSQPSVLKTHHVLTDFAAKISKDQNSHALNDQQFALQLTDVPLKSLLNSFAVNTAKRLSHNNSEVFINLDARIAEHVQIDAVQFNALLLESVDLLITGLPNLKLQIMAVLQDQNPGQQTISLTFAVEPIKTSDNEVVSLSLPVTLKRVIESMQAPDSERQPQQSLEETNKESLTEPKQYLEQLLQTLNALSVDAHESENELTLSYALPMATISAKKSKVKPFDLKLAKILILSPKNSFQKLSQHYLEEANAKVDCLSNFDLVTKQLSITHLEKHRVDLIVLSAEFLQHGYAKLHQHLSGIPASLKPKLFVSQFINDQELKQHGIFGFSQTPFLQNQFIKEIAALLKSSPDDNIVINAEQFDKRSYLPTPTMALLATSTPENYDPFSRALKHLGIQVTFISNEQQLSNAWQSGRYVLLFSEFEFSPFVELDAAPSLKRGIFHINDEQFLVLTQEEAEVANQWFVGKWPESENLSTLAETLKDWIITEIENISPVNAVETRLHGSEKTLHSKERTSPQSDEVKVKLSQGAINESEVTTSSDTSNNLSAPSEMDEVNSLQDKVSEQQSDSFDFDAFLKSNTLDTLLNEEVLAAELANTYDENTADKKPAFNLIKFAQRQGSPVLAAYMLDEYLVEVGQLTAAIAKAIEENKAEQAMEWNQKILSLAEILSANDLTIASHALNEALMAQDFGVMSNKMDQVKASLEDLIQFSEAI